MSRVQEAVEHVLEVVKAAGIKRAVARLEDINPPCVWVAVDTIDHLLDRDALEVTVALFLIPGGADEYRALGPAGDMLDQLLAGDYSPGEQTRTAQIRPTETSTPLAALRTATTITVTKE